MFTLEGYIPYHGGTLGATSSNCTIVVRRKAIEVNTKGQYRLDIVVNSYQI